MTSNHKAMRLKNNRARKKEIEKVLNKVCVFPVPSYEQWHRLAEKSLKGASFDQKLVTETYEGITLQLMYQKKAIEQLTHLDSLPGSAPYLRGTKQALNPKKPWFISQELSAPTPSRFNELSKHALTRGETALHIKLDQSTLLGLGLDVEAEGLNEEGEEGFPITSLKDVLQALDGIDLTDTPLSIFAGAISVPLFSLIMSYLAEKRIPFHELKGCIGADPLAQLVETGSLPYTLDTCFDLMKEATGWAIQHAPQMQTIMVHGEVYHNGGGNAVQEVAFTLATGVEYLRAMLARGLSIQEVAPNIRFSWAIGSNFFMEIAKLRAARMLWSQIVSAFGGGEEAQKMVIHARTSSWNKTTYEPSVNMLRGTVEAFAAAVAGVDSLHVGAFDELIQTPTSFSRRIARNTQLILQGEAHLARQIDPAGGSWYVEMLTDSLAQKAWMLFQEVEEKGGFIKTLEAGIPQNQISEIRDKRRKNMEQRKDVFVGTNMYANLREDFTDHLIQAKDEKQVREQRCREWKKSLSEQEREPFQEILQTLKEDPSNLVELSIAAFRKGTFLHQVFDCIAERSAVPLKIQAIKSERATARFEKLRQASESYLARTGYRPQVFLVNLGSILQHQSRTDFATGFFEVGGFEVLKKSGFSTPEEVVEAVRQSQAEIIIICAKDDIYREMLADLAQLIKGSRSSVSLLVAGLPTKEEQEEYKQVGVDHFIHQHSNSYEILNQLQIEKGVARS